MRTAATGASSKQLNLWPDCAPAEEWIVRNSARARRLSVKVFNSGRVEVVVPPRISRRTVDTFLNQHRSWIQERQAAARRQARPAEAFPPAQIDIAINNERWRVHAAGGTGAPKVTIGNPGLLSLVGQTGDPARTKQALRRWIMNRAAEMLPPLLSQVAQELNLRYRQAVIRRQRTRWGSCSTQGTISLNCCLLFQRPEVVRYLMIHELVHTQHMNHSAHFWRKVAQYCPDYRKLDRELLDGRKRVPAWMFDRN